MSYSVGDRVRSLSSHQGMVEGQEYEVRGRSENRTPFGVFVTYVLAPVEGGQLVSVRNGHLLLESA